MTLSEPALRCLVVADNPADVRLIAKELARAGFEAEIVWAESESEYIARLDPSPDVILCDSDLPQLPVATALGLLRRRRNVPFLVLSAADGVEKAVEAMKLGATDYLLKGRLDRLGPAVRSALDRQRGDESEQLAGGQIRRDALLLAAVRDSVVVTDLDGVVTFWNEGATRLFGWTADEMLGRRYVDRFEKPLRPAIARAIAAREAGTEWNGEVENFRKDGTRVWTHIRTADITDAAGKRTGALRIAYDISERKRAEAELKASETRFRLMADATSVLIWVADTSAGGTYFNKTWLDFTGRSLEQEVGDGWAESVHPDDRDRCLSTYRTHFQARQPLTIEYRLRRRDGVYRHLLDEGVPYTDDNGNFLGFIGSCTDITDYKNAEAERATAQAQREQILRDRETVLLENARLLRAAAEIALQQRKFLKDVLSSVTEGRLTLCDSASELPDLPPMDRKVAIPQDTDLSPEPVSLTASSLRVLRRQVESVADACGLLTERRWDFLMAVSEAAMNAVVHAGGGIRRVVGNTETGTVQVWITDEGKGIEIASLPRATLERGYSTAGTLGHGFWMILQTCDRVYLLTGALGTTVVLEQAAVAPTITWLEQRFNIIERH